MAVKKVGELIKEARTNAGLSQEALAKLIDGVSGSDIGKAERGEKDLPQAALKAIAKATGVTQKSLLEAPSAVKKTAAKKTETSKKSETAKKTTAKTETAKKTTAAAKKTTTAAKTTSAKKSTTAVELTAAEKTLLNAYRKADAETQKAALALLKGEKEEDMLSGLLAGLLGNLGKK